MVTTKERLAVGPANSQRRRQFETIYVQRYWALMDQLSLDALKRQERAQISRSDQRVILSYLRLCEDELELRQEGWISRETWAIWQTGIAAQLEPWPFKPIWCEVDQETRPSRTDPEVTGEFRLLRAFMSDKKDPLTNGSWWERSRKSARRLLTGAP